MKSKFKKILDREVKRNRATPNQVELIMEMQEDANVKWFNRNQIKKCTQKEVQSLVKRLRNEKQIREKENQARKEQSNLWKSFE